MKRWLFGLVMACAALAAWALPTVDEVQAEVARGNYARAEVMMRDVVAERPNSARAQYVLAEVLAHNGRYDDALAAARKARALDPKLAFTTPEKFNDFERRLEQAQRARSGGTAVTPPTAPAPRSAPPAQRADSGLPGWIWGVGGAVIALLIWRMVAARRAAQSSAYGPGAAVGGWNGGQAGPMGPTGAMGQQPGSGRSGLLGAGLAGAGGFAAGMLAEKMLHGHDDAPREREGGGGQAGLAPGMFDDAGGDDLSQRSIDFGSGDGWGGDGGGGSDGGGGGDW